MLKHKVFITLIGLVFIAAFTRLYGLDRQSLWYDEISEVTAFQRQFLEDKPRTIPAEPPLNWFFIHPVSQLFPGNDFALRMVPFVFGLVSVPLMFLLGRQLFDEKVGLLASFLLAISPFHIWYSQEVRMYALLWMLSLLSLIYFLRALEQPSKGNYTGYMISTLAALYTLQFTVFLIALQGLYILIFLKKYKKQFFSWIYMVSIICLLYLPWIIYNFAPMMEKKAAFLKELTTLAIPYTFYTFSAGFSIGPSLRELHLDQSLTVIEPYLVEISFVMFTYSFFFILGLWSLRKNLEKFSLLFLLLVIPIGGVVILDVLFSDVTYNVRYAGIAIFGFLLFIAKGVDWLSNLKFKMLGKILTMFAIITMTGISAYSYANYQFDKKYHKEDVRTAASYIEENKKDGDVILVIIGASTLTLNRYLDKEFQSIGYPSHIHNTNNREEVIRELENIIKDKKRLWLVLCREFTQKELTYYTKQWLDENYTEIRELHRDVTDIANLTIHCYELNHLY